jgi:putative tributyrin esterase
VLPALHIDCGTEDGLLDRNRRFHAHLDTLGIPHQYEEFPDGHSWDYWDRHVQKALAFHAGVLGTSSAS